MTAAGIKVDPLPPAGSKVSLMDFADPRWHEYWLGLPNFYAIMRYNPRTKYAMAVYQLSEAIRERHYAVGVDTQCRLNFAHGIPDLSKSVAILPCWRWSRPP